jgi:holo-[acyl-carrier protein] synthase
MALRVGIDLVSVDAVRQSINEHGDHYLKRIYTEGELRDCDTSQGIIPERLAARFASKEATLKVLRPVDEALPWHSIAVVRHDAGWVTVELNGRAAELASEAGLRNFELSICHEGNHASAIVIAESDLRNERNNPMTGT